MSGVGPGGDLPVRRLRERGVLDRLPIFDRITPRAAVNEIRSLLAPSPVLD
ncbi:hypothetical protein [Micromonospora sp. NBC_00617]|uniref:hypothetical protein n=1 Tax=Micromonospora sp. NBC_00617 TaxID=2903587 RepID=UPI0030E108D0